jgi:hypothetical protein
MQAMQLPASHTTSRDGAVGPGQTVAGAFTEDIGSQLHELEHEPGVRRQL